MDEDPVSRLSHTQRLLSATAGALCTSLLVTPFDVVKVRMQSQLTPQHVHGQLAFCPETSSCSHYRLQTGLMDVWCRKCDLPHAVPRFTSSTDALVKLVKAEGVTSLWKGLAPTLVMSVPNTVVYFALYEHLKELYLLQHQGPPVLAPLVAGVISRVASTSLISPLEMLRTKAQSNRGVAISAWTMAKQEVLQPGGVFRLWRGLPPTLMRDVPFSAIYWSVLEPLRARLRTSSLLPIDHHRAYLVSTFIAGATAGSVAALATHPFDLVKTRRQIQLYEFDPSRAAAAVPVSTGSVIRTIIKEEGWKGLFSGLTARIGKVAPACAIMISSYELAQHYFLRRTSSPLR